MNYNNLIINSSLDEVFKKINNYEIKNLKIINFDKDEYEKEVELIINKNNKLYDIIKKTFITEYVSTKTVQEFTTKLYEKYIINTAKIQCNSEIAKLITIFINKISKIIQYNSDLYKIL
jgi:hypothetical protein